MVEKHANLMITPLRASEFVLALIVMSVVRLSIGLIPVTILAVLFFGFNLWSLGIALAAFFANLLFTSWSVGMFCSGLVLRHGMGAESLAWSLMFFFLPLTCVYYPVTTLPSGCSRSHGRCRQPPYSKGCARLRSITCSARISCCGRSRSI